MKGLADWKTSVMSSFGTAVPNACGIRFRGGGNIISFKWESVAANQMRLMLYVDNAAQGIVWKNY